MCVGGGYEYMLLCGNVVPKSNVYDFPRHYNQIGIPAGKTSQLSHTSLQPTSIDTLSQSLTSELENKEHCHTNIVHLGKGLSHSVSSRYCQSTCAIHLCKLDHFCDLPINLVLIK